MQTNWRIGAANGILLAAYFIPGWTAVALKIVVSPVHGLYDRPNISVALFVSDYLHLAGLSTIRVAWLLALGKLTAAAFFAVFAALALRERTRALGGCAEALGFALGIGALISFGSMVMAAQVGEVAALRLHATELLMLLGGAVVMALEAPAPAPAHQGGEAALPLTGQHSTA